MASRRSDVLQAVRAAWNGERRLGPGFKPEIVELDEDGNLTLAAEVDSIATKKLALERAAAVAGVGGIVDRLRVRSATTASDAEIRDHLLADYDHEPTLGSFEIRFVGDPAAAPAPLAGAPGRILVEVHDGVVILNGEVPGLNSKRLAGTIAWWVGGVRDVVNGLAVRPEEEDAPIRIEEAVRLVLERDPVLDAAQIRVGVRHRTVHLTGLLPSAEHREMAEFDAWSVFGVDDVINDIEVGR